LAGIFFGGNHLPVPFANPVFGGMALSLPTSTIYPRQFFSVVSAVPAAVLFTDFVQKPIGVDSDPPFKQSIRQ
jgi:hypothetical protein